MKIIHILPGNGFDGIGQHILTLLPALCEAGHEVIFAGQKDAWITEQCKKKNIPTAEIPFKGLADIFSILQLRRLAKKEGADILHGHSTRGAHFAGIATWGSGKPATATVHSTNAHKYMRRCTRIIAVSNAVKNNLTARRYSSEKTNVIHNGMPDCAGAGRHETRAALGIAESEFAIVCIGRFHAEKGQDILAGAIPATDSRVCLYFIGDAATEFGEKVRKITNNNARIKFLGYKENAGNLLPAFDACIVPSRREGLSLTIIEALAASVPVIASRAGGIPEIVDEDCGLLVEPENTASLSAAINRLAQNENFGKQLAACGRRRFESGFTVSRMLEQTVAFYEALPKPAR